MTKLKNIKFEWDLNISIVATKDNTCGSTTDSRVGEAPTKEKALKQIIKEATELLKDLENDNVFTY